jgi:hypothetical protein
MYVRVKSELGDPLDMRNQIIGKYLFYHMEGVEPAKHGKDMMEKTDVYAVVQDLHLDQEFKRTKTDSGK